MNGLLWKTTEVDIATQNVVFAVLASQNEAPDAIVDWFESNFIILEGCFNHAPVSHKLVLPPESSCHDWGRFDWLDPGRMGSGLPVR